MDNGNKNSSLREIFKDFIVFVAITTIIYVLTPEKELSSSDLVFILNDIKKILLVFVMCWIVKYGFRD